MLELTDCYAYLAPMCFLGLRGDGLGRRPSKRSRAFGQVPVVIRRSSAGQFEGKSGVGESLVYASVGQREQAFGLIRSVWPGKGIHE
jgi:hypothetical protein